jgi:peroxiredoxin
LAELRTLIQKDDKAELWAVSIDPSEVSRKFAEKIARDGRGEVNFPLLSDPSHRTIDAYGVFDPAYIGQDTEGIPHPAVFIIDRNRRVTWAKVEPNYKFRPTNAEIRAQLAELLKK